MIMGRKVPTKSPHVPNISPRGPHPGTHSVVVVVVNIGRTSTAEANPTPMGVLAGIGRANLHNVESSLVQARLIVELTSQVL